MIPVMSTVAVILYIFTFLTFHHSSYCAISCVLHKHDCTEYFTKTVHLLSRFKNAEIGTKYIQMLRWIHLSIPYFKTYLVPLNDRFLIRFCAGNIYTTSSLHRCSQFLFKPQIQNYKSISAFQSSKLT